MLSQINQFLEPVFRILDSGEVFFNGFTMLGVMLVLVGIQNITRKDLKTYFKERRHLHKIDHLIAWGIFYIIFGTLIAISSILTVSLYL